MNMHAKTPLRVAFTLFGGSGWTGGINYLENLLSAIAERPELGVIPVLFCATDADPQTVERLAKVTGDDVVRSALLNNDRAASLGRNLRGYLLQRDYAVESLFRAHRIDVVFQHGIWLGLRFRLPTVAWIADFQHHHLPQMFPWWKQHYRTLDYRLLSLSATRLMVSSQDARKDCEAFYPRSYGKVAVLPFVVRQVPVSKLSTREDLSARYKLPPRYIYMPNQFWRHKNHLVVIEALHRCASLGAQPIVVASGGLVDNNNPEHPKAVLRRAEELGLGEHFLYLGHIPYQDVIGLMSHSVALINPSLFEGWSTTVEEAKALAVPLLLSGLGVHREQAADNGSFFDPMDPEEVANVLMQAWYRPEVQASAADVDRHNAAHQERRRVFAGGFRDILEEACK